jgi:hypothetical protein
MLMYHKYVWFMILCFILFSLFKIYFLLFWLIRNYGHFNVQYVFFYVLSHQYASFFIYIYILVYVWLVDDYGNSEVRESNTMNVTMDLLANMENGVEF